MNRSWSGLSSSIEIEMLARMRPLQGTIRKPSSVVKRPIFICRRQNYAPTLVPAFSQSGPDRGWIGKFWAELSDLTNYGNQPTR